MSDRKGQAVIFMTMTLTVSMGLIGLVVDIGWAYWRKEACATTANAAAFAAISAAHSLSGQSCGGGSTNWDCGSYSCPPNPVAINNNFDNGCLYAKQNGFLNTGRQTVTLQGGTTAPPAPGVTPAYWVTATVTERIPTLFSAVLGKPSMQIAGQSTAAIFKGSGGCIYVLSPTGTDISMNGVTSIQTGCGIYADSSSNSAITIVGNNGQITATGGASVNVVGNVSDHSPSQISPLPNTSAPSVTDPFAGMTAPTAGSCTTYTPPVISAGTYCSQISLNNGTLTMNPGVYILQGGIDIGGNATVTNNTTGGDGSGGVMLYATGGNFNLHGTPTVTLNGPASGPYRGILMWQDKSDSQADNLKGGSAMTVNGVLYFPTADLTFNGGTGATSTNTSIVSYTLSLVGNSYITAAASSAYSGPASGGMFIIQ
jgi:hypothetical protein